MRGQLEHAAVRVGLARAAAEEDLDAVGGGEQHVLPLALAHGDLHERVRVEDALDAGRVAPVAVRVDQLEREEDARVALLDEQLILRAYVPARGRERPARRRRLPRIDEPALLPVVRIVHKGEFKVGHAIVILVVREHDEREFGLAAGRRDPEVRMLRQRLRATGDFTGDVIADPLFFDQQLLSAVQRFQQRHGLREDGRVSGQTLQLLNLPVESRIAQLEYARDAWAQIPARDVRRRVWVNIPEAAVSAITTTQLDLHMRAVVGHPTRPTPGLSSAIRRVIVNPSWTVPQSIAGLDLLPRQQADAEFFDQRGFDVYTSFSSDDSRVDPAAIDWQRVDQERFPYRLRQRPGPGNSLGRFKFEFPNDVDIYLHDTPARALLGLSVRSLSSGCVRAQDSRALADWLLQSDPRLVAAATDAEWRTRAFAVPEPVPVDLVYLNAWVSADGQVNFRRDVYQRVPARNSLAAH